MRRSPPTPRPCRPPRRACSGYAGGTRPARATVFAAAETRGRTLGLIDVTQWALRRLPANLHLSLSPDSHATRFLLAVAARPGLSNGDLARLLGVDETEISRIGRRLMAAGVVWRRKEWRRNLWDVTPRGRQYLDASEIPAKRRRDRAEPPVARPAAIALRYAVGVTIQPKSLVGVVMDRDSRIITDGLRELGPELSSQEAEAELADFVRTLIAGAPELEDAPGEIGVGVQIGGHVSADGAEVVSAPNHRPDHWTRIPLGRLLAEDLGLPVVVENDANALAEFEHAFRSPGALACTATVLLDEGIGCGIVIDNHLVRGFGGSAGEIGHLVVQPGGQPCFCGRHGCLETVAGTTRIAEPAAKSLEDASALADQGSAVAIERFTRSGAAFGQGLLALLNLVNPEQIVIYGPELLLDEDRFESARQFMAAVREASTGRAFSTAGSGCALVPRIYSHPAGAQAAAAIALLRLRPGDA